MLYTRYVKVQDLRIHEILHMHGLFERYYDHGPLDTFMRDLTKKDGVFLTHRKSDQTIVGFSTLGIYYFDHEGKRVKGLFSGDTILEKEYWGSRSLQTAFARKMFIEAIKRPFSQQYWLLISKGYKTYLLLARNFPVHYPDHQQERPSLKKLVINYCELLYPGHLDQERMVLTFGEEANALKGEVAPITDSLRQSEPAIDFFAKRNPGWADGHELPCVAQADLWSFMKAAVPFLWKAIKGKPAKAKAEAAPQGQMASNNP